MDPARIFDRAALRLHRERAAQRGGDFVTRHIGDELLERLALVRRPFTDILCLGDAADSLAGHFRGQGAHVVSAETDLADDLAPGAAIATPLLTPAAFDLILSPSGLDRVDDLPGTLLLIRRALRPDGLFLAGFVGAGSLPRLREAMLVADLDGGAASPRIHPQIDVRSAGDLLGRAGFAIPVADGEELTVRYACLDRLIGDIRAAGAGNALLSRSRVPLTRRHYAVAAATFAAAADPDGRTGERLVLVYVSGWAPSPDQPRPARRGSGRQSLADILPPRQPRPA